jgi:hypothetical protein
VVELALLDRAGCLQLFLGAHHRVQGHVAEVASQHRVATAIFDVLELAGRQIARTRRFRRSIQRGELQIDKLGRRLVIDDLGRTRTDRSLLRAVVLEQTKRPQIRRGHALNRGGLHEVLGVILGRPHAGSLHG